MPEPRLNPRWTRAARLRGGGWGLVGLGSAGLAVALSRSDIWSDSAAGLAVLTAFLGLLIVEAILLMVGQTVTGSRGPVVPVGARRADGVIDVIPMAAVSALEAPDLAPWKRFVPPGEPGAGSPRGAMPARWGGWRNPPLLGQVAVLSVFVGRDGHGWSGREISAAHQSLQQVGRWVEREASRWGAPVNLGLADTYFQVEDEHDEPVEVGFVAEGDDVGPMEVDSTTKSVVAASRVAGLLGFADVADLVQQINPRVPGDAHVWLFHLKRRGRSHAIPRGDRVIDGVGMAICYAHEASFPEPLAGPGRLDSTTVAHELLHLFGASDKYGVPLSSFPPGSVSRRDVMRLAENGLDRLQIGKLTATELGWLGE